MSPATYAWDFQNEDGTLTGSWDTTFTYGQAWRIESRDCRLIAIAEAYPQLRSNENFKDLQVQLEGTENRIATARSDYNGAVQTYNAYIRQFPQVLTAKALGKAPREYFEVTDAAKREAPQVKF